MKAAIQRYGGVSQLLHWLIAFFALSLLAMGKLVHFKAGEGPLFGIHTALGLTVLMLVRLFWRLGHAVPPPPAGSPAWQCHLARFTHWAFYVLLFALPLSGWLMTSAEGDPVSWFGVFDVPSLPVGKGSEDALEKTHEILGNVLLVLAGLHVLAGLKHHFIDRDDVLQRMLPFGGP